MSIYVIADLHLSFNQDKPMNIFGENWNEHTEKIKNNWIKRVKEEDYIILLGDFSWETYLPDTQKDFAYLNELPGKKILLRGNHDYWWGTLRSMQNFIKESEFENIDFLYNNSYCIENKILIGTRGWNISDNEEDSKMIKRESARLELSIQDGIQKYGIEKEMIAFFHYPPISISEVLRKEDTEFTKILKKYNIKKCYYGHLHGNSQKDAVVQEVDGVTYTLVSADYLNFDLVKI